MICPYRDQVLAALWPKGASPTTSVWAILDGARDARIFYTLRDSGLDYLSLYSGFLPHELRLAAPYLVELGRDWGFTRRLIDQGWGNSWGIFLSIDDSSNLRPHLRKFLRVQDESGKNLIFRYYDPRVMRVFLPTCTPDQLKTMFGPIARYLLEDEDADVLIEYRLVGLRLEERRVILNKER